MKRVFAAAVLMSCLPLLGDDPANAPGTARRVANTILENPFHDDPALVLRLP